MYTKILEDMSDRDDRPKSKSYKPLVIKIVFILFGISLIVVNSILGFFFKPHEVECYKDLFFDITRNLNKYIANNLVIRDVCLIISSALIDIATIVFSAFWIKTSKTWRPVIAITLFLGFRVFVQALFQLKYPEGYLWDYPGFPSLMVSYEKSNDFFFSGHVGIPILIGLEFYYNGYNWISSACLVISLLEFANMIVMRGHYTIDMIGAIVIAHYIFIMVDRYCFFIDKSRFTLNYDTKTVDHVVEPRLSTEYIV